LHPLYVAGSFFGNMMHLAAFTGLAGRFLACCQLGHYRQHRRVMTIAAILDQNGRATQDGRQRKGLRIDAAHPASRAASPAGARVAKAG
jgi:hypothetical protein